MPAAGLIYGSVCSGIEAASVAWDPLGWRAAWFSEIAAFPSRVLAHRWPGIPNHGDFTTISAERAGAIDLLVGGTPCQSFSVAGLRGGLDDHRGNLALEFLRLADRARPLWLVWENVPGVLSSGGGRDFGSILGGMAELGYGFAYRVLDAQYFGVPQRRRRVFVVGYLGDWRRAAAVLFERESMRGDPAPGRSEGEDVAGTLGGGSSARGGNGADTDRMSFVPVPTYSLRSDSGRSGKAVTPSPDAKGRLGLRDAGFSIACNAKGGSGRMDFESETLIFDAAQVTSRTNQSKPEPGAPAHTLAKDSAARAMLAFHTLQDPISGPVSPALDRKQAGMDLAHGAQVRRLTPLECERLQGFPDHYTAIPGAKDGPRYAAIGNSMAVPVMRWIGERIQAVSALPSRAAPEGEPRESP